MTTSPSADALRPGHATIVALTALVLATWAFVTFPLDSVILWHGESYVHLGLQGEAIRRIQAASNSAEVAAGWTAVFHRYPKPIYDLIGVALGLLTGSDGSLDAQRQIMVRAQVFVFFAMLLGAGFFIARYFGLVAALLISLLMLTDQYLQVYSVFPIHQIVGHAFGWATLIAYLVFRLRQPSFEPALALGCGIVTGLAILTHYSAIELIFVFLVSEATFAVLRRRVWSSLIGYAVFLAGISGALLAGEMAYQALRILAAKAASPPVSFAPIDGLVHVTLKLYLDGTYNVSMQKLHFWDFAPYLVFVGSPFLLPILLTGLFFCFRNRSNIQKNVTAEYWSLLIVATACLLFWIFIAIPRHFAVARVYIYYYPAIMVLTAASVRAILPELETALSGFWERRLRTLRVGAISLPFRPPIAIVTAILVLLAAFPRTLTTTNAIRGTGAIDQFLARTEFKDQPVVHLGHTIDAVLKRTVTQRPVSEFCHVPDNAILYLTQAVYIPNFDRPDAEKAVLQHLRSKAYLLRVTDYSGLAVYYYEFLLKPAWHDRTDRLSTTRSLFDAKSAKAGFCPA